MSTMPNDGVGVIHSRTADTIGGFIKLVIRPEAITVLLLVIAFFAGAHFVPNFLDAQYLLDSTSLYMEIGLLALAMTPIIISGNIDLSVAGGTSLVAVCVALLHEHGIGMPVCMAAGLSIGIALGLFNALAITLLRLPSLTVTLGTMALYLGLAQILLGDRSLGNFPDWYAGIDYRHLGMVPYPLIIFLTLALIVAVVLAKTSFGRQVYAIGVSSEAARYSGISIGRITILLFTLSGLMMGAAGLMLASRLGMAQYNMATGFELAAITAVVLGGTDIFGGSGSIFGTVIALFLLGLVRTEIDLEGWQSAVQLTVAGGLLVVSVILTNITGKLKRG
jgi:rhamnose transport system permease protein